MINNQKWVSEQKFQNRNNYCPLHRNIQPIFQNAQNQKSYNITKKIITNQYSQNSQPYPSQTLQTKNLYINMNNSPSQNFVTCNNNQNWDSSQYYLSGTNCKYYTNKPNLYKKIQKVEIIPEADGIVRNFTQNYSLYVSKNTSSKNGPFVKQYKSMELRETKPNYYYKNNQQ